MAESVRTKIINELFNIVPIDEEFKKDLADYLIHAYAKEHDNKVNPNEIIKDVKELSNRILYNLCRVYEDVDVAHEILNCGKDRQEYCILSLLNTKEDKDKASSYLINRYHLNARNASSWSRALFYATMKPLLNILESDDINLYRNFVKTLPYHNINRIAEIFNLESDIAVFLAKNGTKKDFADFITNIRPYRKEVTDDFVATRGAKTKIKSCPREVNDWIFEKIKEELGNNSKLYFERKTIMAGLVAILNDKSLSEKEKGELRDLFVTSFTNGGLERQEIGAVSTFITGLSDLTKMRLPNKFNIIKEYLEMPANSFEYELRNFVRDQFDTIIDVMVEEYKTSVKKVYDKLMATLQKESKEKELTAYQVSNIIEKSGLYKFLAFDVWDSDKEFKIYEDEETGKILVNIPFENKFVQTYFQFDGTALKEIIDRANETSLQNAKKQMEEFANAGVKNLSETVSNYYDVYLLGEPIPGVFNDPPEGVYGCGQPQLYTNPHSTDLSLEIPYYTIDYSKPFDNTHSLEPHIIAMSTEQKEKFNCKNMPVLDKPAEREYKENGQDYTVYDFRINGEEYHARIRHGRGGYPDFHVWRGQDPNKPDKAFTVRTYIDDPEERDGIVRSFITFAFQNPNRFSQFYDTCVECRDVHFDSNCPIYSISSIAVAFIEMPPESDLEAKKIFDKEVNKDLNKDPFDKGNKGPVL